MDVDFDRTIYDLMENGIVKNFAAKQHVAEIERTILTVKDSTRYIVTTMNLKYLHKLIIANIVYFLVLWMNVFPIKNVITEKLLSRTIVVRTNLDQEKILQVSIWDIL